MGWWLKIASIQLLQLRPIFFEREVLWEKGLSYNYSRYAPYFDVHKHFHGKTPQEIISSLDLAISQLLKQGVQLHPDPDENFWRKGPSAEGFLYILTEMSASLKAQEFPFGEHIFCTVDNDDCDHYVYEGKTYTSCGASDDDDL